MVYHYDWQMEGLGDLFRMLKLVKPVVAND
jgi:hypothetical protein